MGETYAEGAGAAGGAGHDGAPRDGTLRDGAPRDGTLRDATLRVACVAARADLVALVRDALALAFPSATLLVQDPRFERGAPQAHAAVVDAADAEGADAEGADAEGADAEDASLDGVRALRASGFAGAIVLLHAAPDVALRRRAARLGVAAIMAPVDVAGALGAAVAGALPDREDGVGARAWTELRRLQQLVAAGELAGRLQHAIANPLTALLAEAQLLEMEPLSPEQRAAVGRILEQCRRTIAVTRALDGVRA